MPGSRRLSGPFQGLSVVLVTAILAVVVLTWWNRRGASHNAWDPRVSALVPIVERLRGLHFDHPVKASLLSAADLAASAGPPGHAAGVGADAQRTAEAMAAMGVGGADPDQTAWQALLDRGEPVAWYDAGHDRITVLGRDPSVPIVRTRLIQQLNHALLDQALGASPPRGQGPADQVVRALTEGDATRVSLADAAAAGLQPPTVAANDIEGLGRSAVDAILAWQGPDGLNATLAHPPSSPAALLDPAGWIDRKLPDLRRPALSKGDQAVDRGVLGPIRWLEILNSPAGLGSALRAATSWEGDSFVLLRRAGRLCLRATVAISDPDQATAWGDALQQWRVSDLAGGRTVESDGTSFRVSSCMSSPAAPSSTPPVWAAIWVNQLVGAAAVEHPRPSPAVARCAAIEAVAQVPLAQLADWQAPRADLLSRANAARASCQKAGPPLAAGGRK